MRREENLENVYRSCLDKGLIANARYLDPDDVKNILENAEIYSQSASELSGRLKKSDRQWMLAFIGWYETLRLYTDAILHLDGKKISNHQCLFAHLCTAHPDLELNWAFFERIRTMRNGVNYYGRKVSYAEWKEVAVQMTLYARTIREALEMRLT